VVWAGSPFAHELDFSTGFPVGAVVYSVLDNNGQPLPDHTDVSIDPPEGAISLLLVVPGSANSVATPLFEGRTLTWNYTTLNGFVSDRVSYRVERPIPFPVSAEGVRTKLGVEPHEVPDRDIHLLLAYANFANRFAADALSAHENSGDYGALIITDAIEATAALMVLPSLRLRIARSESSGTNEYERFASIDWGALENSLLTTLNSGIRLVEPLANELGGVVLFYAVDRTDPFPGA